MQGQAGGGADGARWAAGETGVQWVQGVRHGLHALACISHEAWLISKRASALQLIQPSCIVSFYWPTGFVPLQGHG